MKKRTSLVFIVSLVLVSALLIVYSCKKDDQNPDSKKSIVTANLKMTDSEMLTHIEDFIDDCEYILDNPNETYTETMSVEDVVFNIEAAMNLQYVYYVKSSDNNYETNYLDITTESNGEVKEDNMATLYDEVYDLLKDHYTNTSFTQKKLVLVDIDTQTTTGGTQLVINSAVGNTVIPNTYDEDWWYGYGVGYCDNHNGLSDAAEQLTIAVNDYFYETPTNQNCKYFFTHTFKFEIEEANQSKYLNTQDPNPGDNEMDYIIFFGTSVITPVTHDDWEDYVCCVEHIYEMPFYEENYIEIGEEEEVPSNNIYIKFVEFEGVEESPGSTTIIEHHLTYRLGTRWLMCGTNYPKPIG